MAKSAAAAAPPALSSSQARGIPEAYFVDDDVEAFLKLGLAEGRSPRKFASVPELQAYTQELYQKYKYLENNLVQEQQSLTQKHNTLKEDLQMLNFLHTKPVTEDGFTTDFKLADGLHATARIHATDRVHLWLGANVMLEFEVSEALALLGKKDALARSELKSLAADLDFIKDQVTTMEVNIAKLHNFSVSQRKKGGAQDAASA